MKDGIISRISPSSTCIGRKQRISRKSPRRAKTIRRATIIRQAKVMSSRAPPIKQRVTVTDDASLHPLLPFSLSRESCLKLGFRAACDRGESSFRDVQINSFLAYSCVEIGGTERDRTYVEKDFFFSLPPNLERGLLRIKTGGLFSCPVSVRAVGCVRATQGATRASLGSRFRPFRKCTDGYGSSGLGKFHP